MQTDLMFVIHQIYPLLLRVSGVYGVRQRPIPSKNVEVATSYQLVAEKCIRLIRNSKVKRSKK